MSYQQNKRFYTSVDVGHRHHLELPLHGFGQPIVPYGMALAPLMPAVAMQLWRRPAARRGVGQAPVEAAPPRLPLVTRDGVSFRLLPPDLLAELESEPYFVSPTAGDKVQYAGQSLDAGHVAWVTRTGAETLSTWLGRVRADGNGVLATELEAAAPPSIDGATVEADIEAMLIVTRDLDLVGKLNAADASAMVLFEPAGGWKRSSATKAMLIGGAVLTLAALGAAALMRKKR
jgi:hypothetical protein